MKKVIFGIFAHPDDEAFGPCGTLIKDVMEGAELHLFTLTSGEGGENPDNVPDLGETRDKEWHKAGKTIGTTEMHNLKLQDGHLDNVTMQRASEQIMDLIRSVLISYPAPLEAEFMTFEPNGFTGHIDHIVASRTASFVFYRLKSEGLPLTRIRYYCASETKAPTYNIDWIYADKGRSPEEIDEVVDARSYRDHILEVMQCHHSQRDDYERYVSTQGDDLGLDHFIVRQ